MIEILRPGPLTTVQDGGRLGFADLGVPRSGAFDQGARHTANRLVGNDAVAAVLEVTLGGLSFRAIDAATVALTGAACPGLDHGAPVTLAAGATITLGTPPAGLRSYLAVRGGFAVPPVLGSRSTDTLSGLGPAPLRGGDRLDIGRDAILDVAGEAIMPNLPPAVFRVLAGPRDDWFAAGALDTLVRAQWTVRSDSNRIGVRLDGPALTRVRDEELPSEATLPGALQVPPDGRPILLGPDAPVTGGYPVIAVVRAGDLDAAAQVRPGQPVRFVS